MSDLFPVVVTAAGLTPASPVAIYQQLIANVSSTNPGYTSNLPGSLIDDVVGTDISAILLCNSAMIELLSCMSPLSANNFILNQLGAIYGTPHGTTTNTSVFVVFTGTSGFVISPGWVVSDGTNQYIIQDGGIIGTGAPTYGVTQPLYAVAANFGLFGAGANTVTQLVTSVPAGITLSVTNPNSATPAITAETPELYRSRVLTAGQAVSQGMLTRLKTDLGNVIGVQSRLISVQQGTGGFGGFRIIVGGGDPYQVAGAIYTSIFDFTNLLGSAVNSGRNQTIVISDPPDTYTIVYIVPPSQSVSMVITWNTIQTSLVSATSVAALVTPAIVNYINGIFVGQPINLFELQATFQQAVVNILPTALLTRMVFSVSINSVVTAPLSGTGEIVGDPESFFITQTSNITIMQG